jgi:antitoxin VapB
MGATEKRQGLKSRGSGGMGDSFINFWPWCQGLVLAKTGPNDDCCDAVNHGVYAYILDRETRMPMVRGRTFRSGNSEAIRLPKEVAFGEGVELVIVRSGDVMTIYPAATTIVEMVARLRALPAPPEIEVRDEEELPERAGM